MMTMQSQTLEGVVEVDEMYGGGAFRLRNNADADDDFEQPRCPTGRGDYRPLVLTMAQRQGPVRTAIIPSHSRTAIARALLPVLHPQAVIMTDGLPAYRFLGATFEHHTVIHSQKPFSRDSEDTEHTVHTNTCEAFHGHFRRAVLGVYHYVSRKHLSRYLRQSEWFWSFGDEGPLTRLGGLFERAGPLPYKVLVHG